MAGHLGRARAGLRAFYLADYAVNPLGVKSSDAVREALEGWVRVAQGRASTLVVACNTASARLEGAPEVRELAHSLGIRLFSMVDFLDRTLNDSRRKVTGKRVCLMGTEFTVEQGGYRKRLMEAGAGRILPLAATRTERAIAHFQHESPRGRAQILEEVRETVLESDTVLLACTCFPLVGELLREANPEVSLLDPGLGVQTLPQLEGREGPNLMTVGVTGSVLSPAEIRRNFHRIFPAWELEEVAEHSTGQSPGS